MKIVYGRGGKPDRFYIAGKEVTAEEFRKHCKPKGGRIKAGDKLLVSNLSGWPMRSEALAVHPAQVAEANARNKRHGISVTYDAEGFAHIPDRNERRKLLKLEALHDKNSFTGY
jgi:hypothetical protein